MEEFRDVPNYEGLYQVSNLGRVKSLSRVVIRNNGRPITVKERILKQATGNGGYKKVAITKDKKLKCYKVHQLVAYAFLNHKPSGMVIVIDHIDSDKLNNNLSNLQLLSHRANVSKGVKGGSSKHTGVCWDKGRKKWLSHITINNKLKFLGRFKCELAAAKAYQDKLKEIEQRQKIGF